MEDPNEPFVTQTANLEPTTTLEVSISCRNLLDLDVFSRSDPMCVVFIHSPGTEQWVEAIRTEVVKDSLDPNFATKLTIDYRFEEEQPLRFEVYDIDGPSNKLEQHEFLGYAQCTLGQIVSGGINGLTLPLSQNKNGYFPNSKQINRCKGTIQLLAEELNQLKEGVGIKVVGENLGSSFCKCLFPPQVFFEISKVNEAGKFIVVHRSDMAIGPSPSWDPFTISMRNLCNGDRDRGLQIQCFQEGVNGYHTSLGYIYCNVNRLIEADEITLVGPTGKNQSSKLKFLECKIEPIYTFVEYIRSGTQIHCSFAIDFTSSNGEPNLPTSLHHFTDPDDSHRVNPYEQAIHGVGEIIQDYDNAKMFPVYGFGAKIPPNCVISHKFFINLTESPFCHGIPGVLQSYRNCIRKVQLSGPTNFAPIIREVANMAKSNQNGKHYYVVIMITDGIINDMHDTKEAIVAASSLPLSIIIVGVGDANFDAMDELDGDTVRISSNGKFAERDIVQFVPFRDSFTWMKRVFPEESQKKFSGNPEATNKLAQVKLAQEVLFEIPDQLTSFMKSHGFAPNVSNFPP